MSTEGERWERDVTRALEGRVEHLHDAPLGLDDVRGRARAVRRTRRLALAGGALLAAAVLVPTALAGAPGLQRSADPLPAGPPEVGVDAPRPGWVGERTWVRPDGSKVALGADYDLVRNFGDGLLGQRRSPRTGEGATPTVLDVIGADGTVESSLATRSVPTVDTDATVAAYVDEEGVLSLLPVGGTPRPLGRPSSGARPVDVTGDCAAGATTCRVWYDLAPTRARGARWMGVDGEERVVEPGYWYLLHGTDVGRATVVTSVDEEGADECTAIIDLGSEQRYAETCGPSLRLLSPDGTRVIATPDGLGSPLLVLDAATLDEVGRYEAPGGRVVDALWLDDETVALVDFDGDDTWQVVRLTVAGATDVLASAHGGGGYPPFLLPRDD